MPQVEDGQIFLLTFYWSKSPLFCLKISSTRYLSNFKLEGMSQHCQIHIYVMTHHEDLFDGNEGGHKDILTLYAVKEDPTKQPFRLFLPIKKAAEWSIFLDFCASKGIWRHPRAWKFFQEMLPSARNGQQGSRSKKGKRSSTRNKTKRDGHYLSAAGLIGRSKQAKPSTPVSNMTATSNSKKSVMRCVALYLYWRNSP
jgi:hypothetical protein